MTKSTDAQLRANQTYRERRHEAGYIEKNFWIRLEWVAEIRALINRLNKGEVDQ